MRGKNHAVQYHELNETTNKLHGFVSSARIKLIVYTIFTTGLTGILFADRLETAYSAIRIWLALGYTIMFVSSELLTIKGQLWILLGTVVMATVSNLILEFKTQTKQQLLLCIYRPSKVERVADSKESADGPTNPERTSPNTLSPSHTNPLFAAYRGRRPSNWSMYDGGRWSRKSSFSRTNSHSNAQDKHDPGNDGSLEIAPEISTELSSHINNDRVWSTLELGRRYSVNRAPSYSRALDKLEDVGVVNSENEQHERGNLVNHSHSGDDHITNRESNV